MSKLKVGVLISGRGSNLQALIDACTPDFPAEIVLVISNVPGAYGLERAEKAGIPTATIDHKEFDSRDAFDEAVTNALVDSGVELICLAGFMRLLQKSFVERWHDKIINIHPSLLPSFKGLHTHERSIEAGVRISGCTVHFVRAEVDDGPIIIQAAVPVLPDDTPDALAERILISEHEIYPEALRLVASGQARVEGNKVALTGATSPVQALTNPLKD